MKNYVNFGTVLVHHQDLADYDIDDSKLDLMADRAMENKRFGKFKTLNREDVLIYLPCFTLILICDLRYSRMVKANILDYDIYFR